MVAQSWPKPGETQDEYQARITELRRAGAEARANIARAEAEQKAREAAELLERNTHELESLLAGGYRKFVSRLGVQLSPAQSVLCAICFDGLQPSELEQDERELFETMFGASVLEVTRELLRWLVWVIGGRSGKSYLGALALLWRSLVSDLSSLADGEEATALIVCPDQRLSRHTLKFCSGACKAHPLLKQLITADTLDALTLKRPDGYSVSIEALPATRGGGAVRARTLVAAMLDEVAFFRDESFSVNDQDIYQAVEPRVTIPGGFTLISSTPWIEAGLLYEEYRDNYGHPVSALCAQVSTHLMRAGDAVIEAAIAHAEKKNPKNAAREFGAQFGATSSTLYFQPETVAACIRTGELTIPVQSGARVLVIADAAFSEASQDRFGWAVVTSVASPYSSAEPGHDRRAIRITTVHECGGWEIDRDPREMAVRLRDEVCQRYETRNILIDQYSDRAFQLLCSDVGLNAEIVHWVGGEMEDSKAERYRRMRTAMLAKHLRMPDNPQLRADLAACRSTLLPGGGERIGVPRTRRGHGDVLSAVVLGVSQALLYPGKLTAEEAPEERAVREDKERRAREFKAAQKRAKGQSRWLRGAR